MKTVDYKNNTTFWEFIIFWNRIDRLFDRETSREEIAKLAKEMGIHVSPKWFDIAEEHYHEDC
jgi:hypothetical protein